MNSLQAWLLTYLLNSLWQIPLIFTAAWLAARLSRRAGPAFQHRLWVTALLAEVLLPACSLRPATALRAAQHWLLSFKPNHAATGQVTVTMGDVRGVEGGLHLAPTLLATITVCYIACFLFFTAKLSQRFRRTLILARRTELLTLTAEASQSYHRHAQLFNIPAPSVATSAGIASPVTLGILRPLLLLPADFQLGLAPEDFDAALAHEFAHIRRHDFTKNLLYETLSLAAAFHPLLWLTHTRIAETRELLCDSMAAQVVAGPQRYARSLIRLASRFSSQSLATSTHAIGIFDVNHFKNFERRVMHLTNQPVELQGARRLATATICLGLLTVACTSALAFRLQVVAPSIQGVPTIAPAPPPVTLDIHRPVVGDPPQTFAVDTPPAAINAPLSSAAPIKGIPSPNIQVAVNTDTTNIRSTIDANVRSTVNTIVHTTVNANIQAAEESPAHIAAGVIAGNRLNFIQPVYPPDAKAAGIEGTVILSATIGKDGTITSLKLVSGPDQLAQAAWDAVKQWTYKPYLLNGEPTAVETTITVNFALAK